jgi:GNAT superfamily N-acetyltransferase
MEERPPRSAAPAPGRPGESRLDRLIREARPYGPGDREGLRRFHEEMFGPECPQLDDARFRWLYEDSPSASPDAPPVWLLLKNDRIAGEQAGIPHRLKVGREEYRASWAIDLMVREEWRMRGIGPALSEAHTLAFDVVVAAGATDLVYPAYLRLGWHDLGGIPFFLKPIDLGRLLSMRLVLSRPLLLGTRLVSWGIRALDTVSALGSRSTAPTLEVVPNFDERVDDIWEACSPYYPVIAKRDLAGLRWRFDHPVPAGRYERGYLLCDGSVRGYAVLRVGSLLGAPMGFIVDYLCAPRDTAKLLLACVERFRRQSVAGVVCEILNDHAREPLRRAGFLRVKRRVDRRLLWKAGRGRPPEAALLDDPRNWFLTRADGDVEHPDPRLDRE